MQVEPADVEAVDAERYLQLLLVIAPILHVLGNLAVERGDCVGEETGVFKPREMV